MFMDWKNQYCQNNYTTNYKVVYKFNAISIKMAFFTKLEQKVLTICMKTQKTLNSQSNLDKEEWSWRNQVS